MSGNWLEIPNALTISEAAQTIGTSTTWVRTLMSRGKLRALRTPLGWLLNPEDITRVAAERASRARARQKGVALDSYFQEEPTNERIKEAS